MTKVSLDDAAFLLGETPVRPSQVITLQLFRPPTGVDETEWTAAQYDNLVSQNTLKRAFRRRPTRSLRSASTFRWIDDEPVDMDYHVRRSALPGRGRVRELLEAVSLQHGVALDRRRPLWEFHLFERLEGGRYATAFKTHHAIADGMSLAKHILGSLSTDESARDLQAPWAEPAAKPDGRSRGSVSLVRPATRLALNAVAARTLREMSNDQHARLPFSAPPSPLNVGIGGARRFAGDQWPLERLRKLANAAGCTINDVALAMSGAALRSYLQESAELPDRSLIAMVPVSVRTKGGSFVEGEGNAFGAMLCDLETTTDHPEARLISIREQTKAAKQRYADMSAAEVLAVGKLIMGGAIISSLTGITALPRHPFNLIISNVPAGDQRLFHNGAEMTDIYPVSMISQGQAMNITLTRYAGHLTIGIVGDRRALPHLQRMLVHLENALIDLEHFVIG